MEQGHAGLIRPLKLIHWYDTQRHRAACGAPGQMDSTKYARGVTCTSCLGVVPKRAGAEQASAVSRPE